MSKPTDPCTDEDAARAEGMAKGLGLAHDLAKSLAAEHPEFANLPSKIADQMNELWALAARIRRQAEDLEPITLH